MTEVGNGGDVHLVEELYFETLDLSICHCLSVITIAGERGILDHKGMELVIREYDLVEEIVIQNKVGLNVKKVVIEDLPLLRKLSIGDFCFTSSQLVDEVTIWNSPSSASFKYADKYLTLAHLPQLEVFSVGNGSFQDTDHLCLEGTCLVS